MTRETRLDRGRRMLDRIDGEAGQNVINALEDIAPDFATYLFEYPFGDIMSRPGLGLREREIATVAALCALGTAENQLKVHIQAALNCGVTRDEIVEILMQMSVYAGFPAALNGLMAAKQVFANSPN
ncbi:carboxymuconolactone decarboxylase family protein [Rhodobacteraceae bacterium]|nr:carboxymuconolactone decarboxylase family protein [Paracoccaceae bacterium]